MEGKMIDLPLLGDMGEQTSGGSLSANFASLSQVRGSSTNEPCVQPAVVVPETKQALLLLLLLLLRCGGCMQAASGALVLGRSVKRRLFHCLLNQAARIVRRAFYRIGMQYAALTQALRDKLVELGPEG